MFFSMSFQEWAEKNFPKMPADEALAKWRAEGATRYAKIRHLPSSSEEEFRMSEAFREDRPWRRS